MKKLLIVFCTSLSLLLIGGCSMSVIPQEEKSILYWIPEESHFVDYKIVDDKIIFSYSICFVNDSQDEQSVSLSAKFHKKETNEWIKNNGFFFGNDKYGELLSEKIAPKTKKNIIFYFDGEYLGGVVNTKLSFPYEIVLMN